MKNRQFTHQFKTEVARRRLAGESAASLCRELKLTYKQVQDWTQRFGETVVKPSGEVAPPPEEPVRRHPPARIPMSEQSRTPILGVGEEYVVRGVVENDRNIGRVERMKIAGWEPLSAAEAGLGISTMAYSSQPGATLTQTAGLGATVTYMRKRKELEDKDLEKLEAKNQKKHESIYGGLLDQEGRFGRVTINGHTAKR